MGMLLSDKGSVSLQYNLILLIIKTPQLGLTSGLNRKQFLSCSPSKSLLHYSLQIYLDLFLLLICGKGGVQGTVFHLNIDDTFTVMDSEVKGWLSQTEIL